MKIKKWGIVQALLVLCMIMMFCRWYNRKEYTKAPSDMPKSEIERFHWVISVAESTLDVRARNGKAYGIVQVTSSVTEELNKVYGTKFTPRMCLGNRELSWRMLDLYLNRPEMHKVFGPNPSWTIKAGAWKAGIHGYLQGRGDAYVEKCKRIEARRGWGGPNSLFK